MKVLKFGGTSVGSTQNILSVIDIVSTNYSSGEKQFVVVSAFSGITDMLLTGIQSVVDESRTSEEVTSQIRNKCEEIIHTLIVDQQFRQTVDLYLEGLYNDLEQFYKGLSLIKDITPRIQAKIVSFGELTSSYVITQAMKMKGLPVEYVDPREIILANDDYSKATVDFEITNQKISSCYNQSNSDVLVTGGFVSRNTHGETTVLGRGGSDYSAAIIASALDTDVLEIWTDVSGMYTANPRVVSNAKAIAEISYREALELSHFGAKVIYPPTIHPVLNRCIPIRVKNTFAPSDSGTLITSKTSDTNPIKGISHIDNIALLTLEGSGMIGVPGVSKRLFEALSRNEINVKFITQASSEHSISIGIDEQHVQKAKNTVDQVFQYEIVLGNIKPLKTEGELAMIACVGNNMKNYQGLSGKMFSTLGKNNINVRAIAQGSSENNITAVIDKKDIRKALNCLHEAFFEDDLMQINVFITGVGNVGKKLIDQIKNQSDYLKEALNLKLKVTGLSNSKKMLFSENGINLNTWQKEFDQASEVASLDRFFQNVKSLNLRNSVFVDITASKQVAGMYTTYLRNNIAVVACNKIAAADAFEKYQELKRLSKKYNVPFLFETNVGAGLPVIDTLNNLVASGDKINSIHAVLSGSLNFICNHFNEKVTFHDIVKQTQLEGYTEPDPRIDLSGVDVARKILILARESGLDLEFEQIENISFLTENNRTANSVADFYETLKLDENHFQQLYASASSSECRLRYVASLEAGKAKVELKEIPKGHPFYDLKGKDNIVMFYTERYPEQPLIIRGAGAGDDVTASGIFADIIRIANGR